MTRQLVYYFIPVSCLDFIRIVPIFKLINLKISRRPDFRNVMWERNIFKNSQSMKNCVFLAFKIMRYAAIGHFTADFVVSNVGRYGISVMCIEKYG